MIPDYWGGILYVCRYVDAHWCDKILYIMSIYICTLDYVCLYTRGSFIYVCICVWESYKTREGVYRKVVR